MSGVCCMPNHPAWVSARAAASDGVWGAVLLGTHSLVLGFSACAAYLAHNLPPNAPPPQQRCWVCGCHPDLREKFFLACVSQNNCVAVPCLTNMEFPPTMAAVACLNFDFTMADGTMDLTLSVWAARGVPTA
ncbi:hypothetical protein BKA63DRAFT_485032 [Paraphoma chrysanthemicola]|nr:hypothetical protein BKA63DRAFT_485032 [Paraphoma chrysanthemicola]